MEISRQKSADLLALRLTGRLDANWCAHVQNALSAAVRDGEHRVHLDMAGVTYVSSAGLRVLLATYKQLRAINGLFAVANASTAVREVLELAGLEMLLATAGATSAAAEVSGRAHTSASASYEIFASAPTAGDAPGMRLSVVGHAAMLAQGAGDTPIAARNFGAPAFALGLGALGASAADCAPRFGEFLAVAGTAAFQPADGSSRPDFAVSQGAFVPKGCLLLGLAGEGAFGTLARFEATKEARTLGLAELAQTALDLSGAPAVAFAVITETSGLVGATLQKSPAPAGTKEARFGFPQIRDWLSFTSERAFRDSTSLLVGVAARPGTALDPLLRPLGSPSLLAHVHAAAFPYRPLRKGRIELKPSVDELFDGQALQAVLHLLADPREFSGAGESEFFRGALWLAPLQP
jgi:anti-anti-sigma factor